MVAFGTFLSAFWILSANSWMQTPAGHAINAAGQFVPVDWWAIIFNPSFPYRLVHMVIAAYLTTALVVGAVGAWHLLRDRTSEALRASCSRWRCGWWRSWRRSRSSPATCTGSTRSSISRPRSPRWKVISKRSAGAPLILFGWPDMEAEETRYAIEIPQLGSLILTHDWNGVVRGLKEWPREDRPNAPIVFWSFRIMVGLGFLMLGLASGACGCAGAARSMRSRLDASRGARSWGRWGSSPCSPAGSRPKSGASPTRSMACCAPPNSVCADRGGSGRRIAHRLHRRLFRRLRRRASSIMLRLMGKPPVPDEPESP